MKPENWDLGAKWLGRGADLRQTLQTPPKFLSLEQLQQNLCGKASKGAGSSKEVITHCIGDEEVVAQQAVVQHGGNKPLQPRVAPVRAQRAHLHEER